MTRTRFIYFDLGNVLVTFDHSISCRRIATQTGLSEDRVRDVIFESGLQLRYEAGEIDSDEFAETFTAETGKDVDHSQFLVDCSDVFELNTSIVPVVANLRSAGYRLGILSNTCQAHWDFISRGRYTILHELFDVVILSYEQRALKPERSIFDSAVAASGVEPPQVLFIDDRPENVDGAQRAGLEATVYRGVQPLIQELRRRKIDTNL